MRKLGIGLLILLSQAALAQSPIALLQRVLNDPPYAVQSDTILLANDAFQDDAINAALESAMTNFTLTPEQQTRWQAVKSKISELRISAALASNTLPELNATAGVATTQLDAIFGDYWMRNNDPTLGLLVVQYLSETNPAGLEPEAQKVAHNVVDRIPVGDVKVLTGAIELLFRTGELNPSLFVRFQNLERVINAAETASLSSWPNSTLMKYKVIQAKRYGQEKLFKNLPWES